MGILFIKEALLLLPQLLSIIIIVISPSSYNTAMMELGLMLLLLLIYLFISYSLIFKTEWLAEQLKLYNTTNDETILVNIHRSTVLSISILVIGGLILAEEIPSFCRLAYSYWEAKKENFGPKNDYPGYLILAGVKILIGLLLLGNQRSIVSYIELKRKK